MGEIYLMLMSVGLVVLGIWFAWYLYIKRTDVPEKIAKSLGGFYRLLYNKYYVDQIYDAMFVNRAKDLGLAWARLTRRDQRAGRGWRGMADARHFAHFDVVGHLDRGRLVNLGARPLGSEFPSAHAAERDACRATCCSSWWA